MAVSWQLCFSCVFVAAAASLHFSSLHVDARATPLSHFFQASPLSTISAPPTTAPAAAPSVSPVQPPYPEESAPLPSAIARPTGGRGYGLYGRESSVTADELYKIESQLDEDDDDAEESFEDPKSTTPASTTPAHYGAGNTKAVSTPYRGGYGVPGRNTVTSTAATGSYGFGKVYSQEESDLDGHNRNNPKNVYDTRATETQAQTSGHVNSFYYPGSTGNNNQGYHPSTTTTTPIASTKAQSTTFGNNVYFDANKLPESATKSTATPNTYPASRSSNDYTYFGMSDTRRPENVQAFYEAAKGKPSSSTTHTPYSGNYAQTGYNQNSQSQNEFATMEEYYKSQGIRP